MSEHKPAPEEHKPKPTAEQIRDYELAGGVEGGMPAGSAGGPGQADAEERPDAAAKDKKGR